MQLITRYLLLLLLSLTATSITNGEEQPPTKATNILLHNKLEYTKAGCELTIGFYRSKPGITNEFNIFGEYRFHRKLGIRVGIAHIGRGFTAKSTVLSTIELPSIGVNIKSIDIPVTIRLYPLLKLKEYCLFSGLQLGYVTGGWLNTTQRTEFIQKHNAWNYKDMHLTLAEASKKVQVQRFQLGIVGGFDYEFYFGLSAGFHFYKSFVDVIKIEELSTTNYALHLGYNFIRLLKYLY
jgi:hypothetical protein